MMRAGRFQLRREDRDRPVHTSHGQAGAAYDPVSGNNDNGLEVRQVLDYGQKQGYADDQGNRYKTGTYISIEPANWQALRECCYLFDVVTVGLPGPAVGDGSVQCRPGLVGGCGDDERHRRRPRCSHRRSPWWRLLDLHHLGPTTGHDLRVPASDMRRDVDVHRPRAVSAVTGKDYAGYEDADLEA